VYARTSTWTGTSEALDRWASHVSATVAPNVSGVPGNAGAYFFVDRDGSNALTLTMWESEEAAIASDGFAEKSRASTVDATGVELLERGRFEVVAQAHDTASNKELSKRFTELFSTGDEELADAILSPDVVFHGTSGDGEVRGLDALKAFVVAYRAAFPDARSTVESQYAEGDVVITRWRAGGTHGGDLGPLSASGRSFEMDGITIERIAGGKIVEVWVARDELGLLRQLGLVPEPAAAAGV
jgi:steroid delta-isomerase-like uncharacterized protein